MNRMAMTCRALALTALLLIAAGGARAQDAVKFGVCLPLSGEFWEHGGASMAGVAIRVAELAEDPAAPRLEMVVRDNGGDPELAIRQLGELAGDPDIAFVIGPGTSGGCAPLEPHARELGLALISPTVTQPGMGQGDSWAFSVLFSDDSQGALLARHAMDKGLGRAAAIFDPDLAYSQSIFASFRRAYEKLGGRLVAEHHFSSPVDKADLYDFTKILTDIKRANPDVVLLPSYHEAVSAIIRQSQVVGFRPVFIGGDTWAHEGVVLASGHNLNGAFFVNPMDVDNPTPELAGFLEQLNVSNEELASYASAMGYDAVTLGVRAASGAADRAAVRDNLFAVRDLPLATGKITIDREHGILKTAHICEILKEDGEFVVHTRASFAPSDMLREQALAAEH